MTKIHILLDTLTIIMIAVQSTYLIFSGVYDIRKIKDNDDALLTRNNAVSAYRNALYSMLILKLTGQMLKEYQLGLPMTDYSKQLDKFEAMMPSYEFMMESDKPLIDKYFLTEELKEIIYIKPKLNNESAANIIN